MAKRFVWTWAALIWPFSMVSAPILHAEQRFALLIGNQGYEKESRLVNPHNDIALMETALKKLHFEVAIVIDAARMGADGSV
jgi:hypothetical protein